MLRIIYDIVKTIKDIIKDFVPETAVILGSGLGGYSERITVKYTINFADLDGFPVLSVVGHSGKFLFGTVNNKNIVIMSGRVHYYEGYPMQEVVLPIRVLKLLGVKTLIVTNAAGGVNPEFEKGDIMVIKDHISLFCPNPLIGDNYDEIGVRFPDMTHPYDLQLIKLSKKCAEKVNMGLKEGVYCYLTGPSYETASDVKAIRTLGADSVGMSTVPEVIAARHAGMTVCGFSYIANKGVGLTEEKLTHTDVLTAFKKSEKKFYDFIDCLLAEK